MATKLLCPDCGGVIGEATSETDVPCTCLHKPSADEQAYSRVTRGGDDEPSSADAPTAGESHKTCRICGKDVTGAKRYRDTLGYWCVDCHQREKRQRMAGQLRCTGCGRMFPREKLVETDVDRLCKTCNRERIARQRAMLRSAEKRYIHNTYEKKQLYVLLGIAALLALIILLARGGIL